VFESCVYSPWTEYEFFHNENNDIRIFDIKSRNNYPTKIRKSNYYFNDYFIDFRMSYKYGIFYIDINTYGPREKEFTITSIDVETKSESLNSVINGLNYPLNIKCDYLKKPNNYYFGFLEIKKEEKIIPIDKEKITVKLNITDGKEQRAIVYKMHIVKSQGLFQFMQV